MRPQSFFRAIVFSLCSSALCAQSPPPLWGTLDPGPYAVGFRILYRTDSSRTWDALSATTLKPHLGRPVRISIWYPAKHQPRGVLPMRYDGYFEQGKAPDATFAKLDALIERADLQPTHDFIFKGDEAHFRQWKALTTNAYRNAPAASGRFPLIAYSEGYNNRSHDNAILCEYLASHGFVVVTVPQVGTRSTRLVLSIDPVDIETQTRDLEYAIGIARALPDVDPAQLGVMGYSMGGVVALRIAGRTPGVRGIVGLDPSIRAPRFVQMVTAFPEVNARQLRMPFLSLQSGASSEASAQDTTVVHLMRFSERRVGAVSNAMHGDFSDFPMYATLFPLDVQGRTAAEAHAAHEAVSRYVLAFFRGTLTRDSAAFAFAMRSSGDNGMDPSMVRMQRWRGITAPSEEEFVASAILMGSEYAVTWYRNVARRNPGVDLIDQRTMNRYGYGQMEAGNPRAAVGLFQINAEAHPTSADAWDSLAEGLIAAGDKPAAKKAYQRLLVVLPNDSTLDAAAKEEYLKSTEEKIRGLP